MTGAKRPTASETRAPWMSRANSSRPRPSARSQCSIEAGARRSSMSMSVGLGSGSRPTNAATAKIKIIQPIAAQNSIPSRRVLPTGATATSSPMSSSSVAMSDPGIEDGVQHVDDKIHQHEAAGDEQHHALQNDEVPGVDGADQQPPDPRQRANPLHAPAPPAHSTT